jgi:hypothetical protein
LDKDIVEVNNRRVHRFGERGPIAGAALASIVLLSHLCLGLASASGVNHVSGVWLTLARDVQDGVFYRALSGSGAYGGTRYFPLLFSMIAGFMRAGVPAIRAGQLASLVGAVVLVTGAFALLTALGRDKRLAVVGGVLAVSAYFVQQSVLAIRAEPLATGLALWGAAFVADRQRNGAFAGWAWCAAAAFCLAVAAKPTTGYAGVAAVLALACSRRYADAARLGLLSAGGICTLILAIALASDGRALESFRACALAGSTMTELFRPSALAAAVARLAASRLLVTMLVVSVAAVALAPRRLCALPTLLLAGAVAATVAALATEGTILTNQIVDPYVAAAVFLTWISGERGPFQIAGAGVLTGLMLWTSAQNTREIKFLIQTDAHRKLPREQSELIERVRHCEGPLLAESPLVPILARRPAILLDPFAFRVASRKRPGLAEDLIARLERLEFGCVILDHDPASESGQGWYRNVHLGRGPIEAVTANYRLQEIVSGYRFYVPAPGSGGHARDH